MVREKIVETAYLYEGKEELKGNSGFEEDIFQKKMEAVGWSMGQAWCSYFAELVWKEGYGKCDSSFIEVLDKLFSANAVKAYTNFKKTGWEISTTPEPGDLVVWMSYKDGKPKKINEWYLGHIGVVTKPAELFFLSMEGNTNSYGGREGIEVAEMKRKYDFNANKGLRLLGFVKPKEV